MTQMITWLAPSLASHGDSPVIATLGPAGTSSEAAAEVVRMSLDGHTPNVRGIELFRTYEGACEALLNRDANYLVVANAYHGINEFYMHTKITLAGVFVMDTPYYGVAAVPGVSLPDKPVVATHPAPRALVAQLLPTGFAHHEILEVTSTSMAARAVRDGTADLALTTLSAADANELEFISRQRVIRMLWSVFMLRSVPDGDSPAAPPTQTANPQRNTHARP